MARLSLHTSIHGRRVPVLVIALPLLAERSPEKRTERESADASKQEIDVLCTVR